VVAAAGTSAGEVTGTLPLAGQRVIDLTRFVSGSYATAVLAALGADVIKVEPPDGDPYRQQGTQRLGPESVLFLSLNSGKRSVVLDFKKPDGRTILDQLLSGAAFFVENGRPGSLAAHGFDFASVHERHPHLVYGSISGYGDVGPDATRGGFDLVLQAAAGVMSVTGTEASGPVKVGAPVLDIGAALSCVIGLLAAHLEREQTGRGRHVSASLFEFAVAAMSTVAADYLAAGVVPGLLGTHSPSFAPYGSFRTADGWVVLAGTGSEELWHRTCSVIGYAELAADPRFRDNASRVTHRDELTARLEEVLATGTSAEWLERFDTAGIPASEVRDLGQVLTSDQVAALGTVQVLEHQTAGPYRIVGLPFRFDGIPLPVPGAAPALGVDTELVVQALSKLPAQAHTVSR
jgi:crotonobetainyl-CoA:carnitine CoA-transferase CaiB-like acyl-CoA transferase